MLKLLMIILSCHLMYGMHLRNSTMAENFINNCTSINYENSILKASCINTIGAAIASEISLDECIVNFNGKLLWTDNPNGFFSQNCDPCSLKGTLLECSCEKIDHTKSTASINLKDGIQNENGTLKCIFLK